MYLEILIIFFFWYGREVKVFDEDMDVFIWKNFLEKLLY